MRDGAWTVSTMWVTVERIPLNSDAEFFRGSGLTAASPNYQPSSPRLPPERAKIAAKASATDRHRGTLLQGRRLSSRQDYDDRTSTRMTRNYYTTLMIGSIKGDLRQRHHQTARRDKDEASRQRVARAHKNLAKQRQRKRKQEGETDRDGVSENTRPAAERS